MTVPPTPPDTQPEQPVDDLGFKLPEPAKPGAGRMTVLIVLVLLALIGAFLFGYLPRRDQSAALARDAKQTETEEVGVEVVQ
ncbi:MAG TPA: efflux RND transporter periplasmic adaptor subunit, partial [Polyangiales bacterium]|nr:efflux RND transporter periplasmic adaptor subunit [Polyangiales bacterium]